MRRILFLDIDGVLNGNENYRRWHDWNMENPDAGNDDGVDLLFDVVMVERLNQITETTGAEIVISSSWRNLYSTRWDFLKDLLKKVGVKATVIDKTPCHMNTERGDEILTWLNANVDEAQIVVLDDCDDMTAVEEFFLQTDGRTGLSHADVSRAVYIMESKTWRKS